MSYKVRISTSAQRQFKKLPHQIQDRAEDKMLSLEHHPRLFGSQKLINSQYYRLRIGTYRIIYSIDDTHKSVTILDIAHRREVYR